MPFRQPTIFVLLIFLGAPLTISCFALQVGSETEFSRAGQQQGQQQDQVRSGHSAQDSTSSVSAQLSSDFDGDRAYHVLRWACSLGPRVSGTNAMKTQQDTLEKFFTDMGGTVSRQTFMYRHPIHHTQVEMTNLIVEWHPERKDRILICCHYDTRPYPDRDRHNPRGRFIGANDGASGVGLLFELGRHVKQLGGDVGVDFVFFDAEEFVFQRGDPLFVGSTYFSEQYVKHPPAHRYRRGVLVDMIGDANLQIYKEKNSLYHARELTTQIWTAARELGVSEFIDRARHKVRDDHEPLNQIARIPTCDIIDFDYPTPRSKNAYWHTTQDTEENCVGASCKAIGG